MKNIKVLLSVVSTILLLFGWLPESFETRDKGLSDNRVISDTEKDFILGDTIPDENKYGDHTQRKNTNPYDLNNPDLIKDEVEYDPITDRYIITQKIGDEYIGPPTYMTFDEYMDYKAKQQEKEYFDDLAGVSSEGFSSSLDDPLEGYTRDVNLVDRLFGGKEVSIRPDGNIDLALGFNYQELNNPSLTRRNQRTFTPDFDVDINLSVTGNIGEKLNLNTNFNTQSQFDFDRQIKLKFDSEQFSEDDIIQKIEAGNVSLPLRSNLIQGAQSLFGLKVQAKFGHLNLTGIVSQQQSQKKQLRIENGAQVQYYEKRADEYDENRHFFLSHYNRHNYERSLKNLPQVNSLFQITRLEVWVTNIRDETQGLRDIVALADLGESEVFTTQDPSNIIKPSIPQDIRDIKGDVLPENDANRLFELVVNDPMAKNIATALNTLRNKYNLSPGRDFDLRRARKLSARDYTFHPELGFISVNVPLRPDEVLAVAYEYDYNGQTYSVGQLDSDNQLDSVSNEVLFVKMLKSTQATVGTPLWDLMMKNVYAVGAYQANRADFFMDVYYDDAGQGLKRFLPEPGDAGKPLLQVFNLDNLNVQGDPQPDGRFDYVPGITILPQSGKVIFPVLEPFGESLKEEIGEDLYEKYGYPQLYDSTLVIAREYQENNRFLIKGEYQSSVSSEISLGTFNLPEGSVTVRAGGRVLRENIDYEVDYKIGIVRIINESILAGGTPIDVSFEDNSLFSFQQKSMVGLRADYALSRSLSIGATYMHLWEKPFTQKVNIGEDPISNRIFGLDLLYEDDAPWLTRLVDKIPGIDTKEESQISFYTEGAWLKPGHARAIDASDDDDTGAVYVDDFEGATGEITLISPLDRWVLSSIPQGGKTKNNPRFPESDLNNDLRSGMNRALINWYQLDQFAAGNSAYDRIVSQQEIFRNRTLTPGQNIFRPFDVVYYPNRRGPYNFEPPGGTEFSAGLNQDGTLRKPESRWGGIMRDLITNDFQQTNIEYIEFWLLNPFIPNGSPGRPGSEGEIVINLGNISEDILKDGRSSFENGLPTPSERVPLDTSVYGISSIETPYIYAFNNDPAVREIQDVGYDGLQDEDEVDFFNDYLEKLENERTPDGNLMNSDFIQQAQADPANDNFIHWDDAFYENEDDILTRYETFNGSQGNSPISDPDDRFPKSFTIRPNTEDPNRDFTSDQIENYFSYTIPIERSDANPNLLKRNEFVIDTVRGAGSSNQVWYRFKIPVQQYTNKVGNIQDFRSIRFMRMFFTEFSAPTVFRFATLDLVRNQWRRWRRNNLLADQVPDIGFTDNVEFDVNEVSIEENSQKTPFNYVLPIGIQREQNFQTTANQTLFNEQSLALNVCNLEDGQARAIFKNTQRDIRLYERLKMFVHAEGSEMQELEDGEVSLFMRFGSDYTQNYYEYEMPLTPSNENESINDPLNVWRPENNMDLKLDLLIEAKLERNNTGFPLNEVFVLESSEYPGHTIKIKGNPNLGYVKGFMIGVRNVDDDKGDLCAEVWVNELRVSGLDEQGGAAALARLDMQLADFGSVSLSGNYSTIGWGGIEEKLGERAREEVLEYDASANLELSKFLPEESGVKIPVYGQISQSIRTPQFDPYDLDIELDRKLDDLNGPTRDSVREQALDVTTIKSINATNVRKEFKGEGKPMPWSISNFTATYGFTESDHRDPLIELDNTKNHHGVLRYNYRYDPLYIEPFKNMFSETEYLDFIKELHFNFLPNAFGHNSTVDRTINVRRYRFSNPEFSTWYDRQFTWNRDYSVRWDLTRTLSLDYNATNFAVIDELDRDLETPSGTPTNQTRKEYLWNNIQDFGRTKDYNHSITASWNVPLKNFPFLDFINLTAQSTATYAWNAASLNVDSLGNTIQNGQQHSVNATLSFDRLYDKVGYLKRITSSGNRRGSRGRSRRTSGGSDDDEKQREISTVEKLLVSPLLMLKTARATYSLSTNSVIPGFMPQSEFVGMDRNLEAPGWEYILGFTPEDDYLYDAAENKGWITASRFLSRDLIRGRTENWSGEVNLEPWKDLKIDLNIRRDFNQTSTYLFKNKDVPDLDPYTGFRDANYQLDLRNSFGSYTITYLAINTLFNDELSDIAGLFNTYEDYRSVISTRLYPTGDNHETNGAQYKEGYGRKQPEVLIPAFLAAYTGKDPNDVKLNLFDQTPLPNWSLNYNGLSRLPMFKDIFRNVSIRHSYNSTLQVNRFQSNGKYEENAPLSDDNKNEDFNFYSEYYFPELQMRESMSPLIGLSIKTTNDISFDLDYSKTRELSLNFTNSFLHETRSESITVNFGYLIKDLNIKFLSFELDDLVSGSRRSSNNNSGNKVNRGQDMNIAIAFTYGDDVTLTHQLDIDRSPTPERGIKTIRINPTIEYDMNKYMNLQAYFEYSYSEPATSQSFPITNMRGGLRLRFKLQ